MRLLLASLMLVSFSAFANDIVKVTDGSVALCKTKVDVMRYATSGIYRPVSFVRTEDSATLTVEFLRCVQQGDSFAFVRDNSLEKRIVTVKAGPFSREDITVEVKRNDVTGVAFASSGRVYNRGDMKKNADNTYTQKMPIESANFEVNRNGDRFFEMTVAYKVKITNQATGAVLDSKLEHLGSYRIYVK
ncbi:MAG: hypothetical protein V4598_00385 [Bdellovibrionota bacterium]